MRSLSFKRGDSRQAKSAFSTFTLFFLLFGAVLGNFAVDNVSSMPERTALNRLAKFNSGILKPKGPFCPDWPREVDQDRLKLLRKRKMAGKQFVNRADELQECNVLPSTE